MQHLNGTYKAIVLGVSSGGFNLIQQVVKALPANFCIPIIIVQHIGDYSDGNWSQLLNKQSAVSVKEADEKEIIRPGYVYTAPANYHLLIESNYTFTLTLEGRVNYARPSIDVLFETAADAYRKELIGIIGTGANADGAEGLHFIDQLGGLTIVQDPETAEMATMPKSAIELNPPDFILSPYAIIQKLLTIHQNQYSA